jgi:hypothetical protein
MLLQDTQDGDDFTSCDVTEPNPDVISRRFHKGKLFRTATMFVCLCVIKGNFKFYIRRPFEKFEVWRQCAAVMQREAVTVMPSCSCGGKAVVA